MLDPLEGLEKNEADLYGAWKKYTEQLDEYDIKIYKKPSFYELKLNESGLWFNYDRYARTQLNAIVRKIIGSVTKKPFKICKVHVLNEKKRIYLQYILKDNEKLSFYI